MSECMPLLPCMCSPAHLNALVGGRYSLRELEELLFTADWELAIDCESACSYSGGGGGGGGGRTPLTPPSRSATTNTVR